MDLRLFHPNDGKTYNHKVTDRRNRRSGFFACHFLEWIGWYNQNIAQRLLGHYRLFQLFKIQYLKDRTELTPAHAYILQYRETRHLKLFFARFVAFLTSIIEFGTTDRHIEIHSINHRLLNERSDILQNFLAHAEGDFEQAFLSAMELILDPQFQFDPPARQVLVQINEEHQYNTTFAKSEFHVHPIIRQEAPPPTPAKGKEKDVFSKKQILILFDLLTITGTIEPINLHKPNKFPAVAHLLRAITGKSEESWVAELNDHRNKDLYTWHFDGERRELIRILINLAEKFGEAGFKKIADAANQKIRELEHAAR